MSKLLEVTVQAKAAWQALTELMSGPISIEISGRKAEVHLGEMRDLEQVPGEYAIEPFGGKDHPWQAVKDYDGFRFFVLLTQEEYEAARQAS